MGERLQQDLNRVLRQNELCRDSKQLTELSFKVLQIFPDDQAAYHTLMRTALIQGDLKLVFLIAQLGQSSTFRSNRYTYMSHGPNPFEAARSAPVDIMNAFLYWDDVVFEQSYVRKGEEIEIDLIDCEKKVQHLKIPTVLTAIGIPNEFLKKSTHTPLFIDLRDFQNLSDVEFQNRLFAEIKRSLISSNPYPPGRPPRPANLASPEIKTGTFSLNLEHYQAWGSIGRTDFQIREGNTAWQTYTSDKDQMVKLELPIGRYYLQVGNQIKKAFILNEGKVTEIHIE